MIIVFCGLPGTGKSVVAAAVAKRIGAAHVSSDAVRRRLFLPVGFAEFKNLEDKFIYDVQRAHAGRKVSEEAQRLIDAQRALVYNAFFLLAEELARAGKDVVLDATFYREAHRATARALARRLGQKIFFVQTVCPDEIVKRRMERRGRTNLSNARYRVYLEHKKTFKPLRGPHLLVDTTHALRESVSYVLKYVGWRT